MSLGRKGRLSCRMTHRRRRLAPTSSIEPTQRRHSHQVDACSRSARIGTRPSAPGVLDTGHCSLAFTGTGVERRQRGLVSFGAVGNLCWDRGRLRVQVYRSSALALDVGAVDATGSRSFNQERRRHFRRSDSGKPGSE